MKKVLSPLALLAAVAAFCLTPLSAQSRGYHQSGITGEVTGFPASITQCNVLIVSAADHNKFQTVVITDNQLHFDVGLKPGLYTLIPFVDGLPGITLPPGSPVVVEVTRKQFLQLTLVYAPQGSADTAGSAAAKRGRN